MAIGPLELAAQVAAVLDRLGIAYVVGGSFASSLVGEPRATADIDVALVLPGDGAARLVEAVRGEFYVSAEAAAEAVRRHSSFNLIHLDSVMKVDLFVLGDGLLDRRQIEGRRRVAVGDVELWVGAPEDQVLRKLSWYRLGGEVSDRQWRDVVAILAVQRDRLDYPDLRSAARTVGLADLLERAIQEGADWQ